MYSAVLFDFLQNIRNSSVVDVSEAGEHLLGEDLCAALEQLPGPHLLVAAKLGDHLCLPHLGGEEDHLDLPLAI